MKKIDTSTLQVIVQHISDREELVNGDNIKLSFGLLKRVTDFRDYASKLIMERNFVIVSQREIDLIYSGISDMMILIMEINNSFHERMATSVNRYYELQKMSEREELTSKLNGEFARLGIQIVRGYNSMMTPDDVFNAIESITLSMEK